MEQVAFAPASGARQWQQLCTTSVLSCLVSSSLMHFLILLAFVAVQNSVCAAGVSYVSYTIDLNCFKSGSLQLNSPRNAWLAGLNEQQRQQDECVRLRQNLNKMQIIELY